MSRIHFNDDLRGGFDFPLEGTEHPALPDGGLDAAQNLVSSMGIADGATRLRPEQLQNPLRRLIAGAVEARGRSASSELPSVGGDETEAMAVRAYADNNAAENALSAFAGVFPSTRGERGGGSREGIRWVGGGGGAASVDDSSSDEEAWMNDQQLRAEIEQERMEDRGP